MHNLRINPPAPGPISGSFPPPRRRGIKFEPLIGQQELIARVDMSEGAKIVARLVLWRTWMYSSSLQFATLTFFLACMVQLRTGTKGSEYPF